MSIEKIVIKNMPPRNLSPEDKQAFQDAFRVGFQRDGHVNPHEKREKVETEKSTTDK